MACETSGMVYLAHSNSVTGTTYLKQNTEYCKNVAAVKEFTT